MLPVSVQYQLNYFAKTGEKVKVLFRSAFLMKFLLRPHFLRFVEINSIPVTIVSLHKADFEIPKGAAVVLTPLIFVILFHSL